PPNIFEDSTRYARVVFLAFPILFTYIVYASFLRGTGDSRTPFLFLILSTALTMVITPAFIFGWLGLPHMGVLSAAFGNILATTLSLSALAVTLYRTKNALAPSREMLRALIPRGR